MPSVKYERGRLYQVAKSGAVTSCKRDGSDKRDEGLTVVIEPGWRYWVDGSGEVKREKRKAKAA